ncbi:Dps family protein [Aquimarina agarivorans]|uniref:Dps family protein n=1 Tax=Aquimarina agarivorans TaxID=980584 RepID=UPI000248EA39|nr:DNA starvation/stationary phase protection protein [Aquimarina agarivorans]
MNYLNMNNEKLIPVVSELNILLAEYHMYYQKLRNFHWNIIGKNFFDLHEKFEDLYGDARTKIDEIAERILTLQYHPISKYSEYLQIAKIQESDSLISDKEMVEILLGDHGTLLSQMRKVVKNADEATDEGTIDLIGAYIRELEKSSWMLNAWSKSTADTLKTMEVNEPA